MSNKKNIDRIFQEKFNDFEVIPSPEVWANIEAKLDEKKKRRVIPFWWKLSGVAAVLLVGFLISKVVSNAEIKTVNAVVNESNSNKQKEKKSDRTTNNEVKDNVGITFENRIVLEIDSSKIVQKNNTISTSSNNVENNSIAIAKDNKTKNASKIEVTERKTNDYRSLRKKSNQEKNKTTSAAENGQDQLVQNPKNNSNSILDKEGGKTVVDNNSSTTISKKNNNLDGLNEGSISKISTHNTVEKENDSVQKNSIVYNALEELLNEKESKLKQESKRNRWQIASNVAPIFLGSMSNGSPIDSTLSQNSKSYNNNVGFGIGVSYAVNKKLSVRTGLNKVNMSYNTNDIVFFTGIQAKKLANVSPTASSAMIQIQSSAVKNNVNSVPENNFLPFENTLANRNTGYLNQQIGYVEMPVEMTYAILDKKFGIRIIGGFSTLFLENNTITIISDDRKTLLGEANNLNTINFSTNLGLGIKYGFAKSFEFNIEPTVKYQLNTFSSDSGNFKTYIIGIYSGISYKF